MLFTWRTRKAKKQEALSEQHTEITDKYNLILSNLDAGINYAKEAREKLHKIQEMLPAGAKK